MNKRTFILASAAAAAVICAPRATFADGESPYAKEFNVKFAGYAGTTTLTNFPALIRLSKARNAFDYSKCKLADGADTRFFDADGNLLPSEVDTWNPDGESLVWVSVPELNRDTTITVRYGNANAPAVMSTDVWTNGYVAVWHMKAVSGRNQLNSTTNSLTISLPSDCADNVIPGAEGIVGKAADMGHRVDGLGNYGLTDSRGLLDGFANATFEIWTKQDANPTNQAYIIVPRNNASRTPYSLSQYTSGNTAMAYYVDVDGTPTYIWGGSYETPLGAWNHHAFRFNSGTGLMDYFQNGVSRYAKVESAAIGRNLFSVKDQFTVGSYTTKWTENRNFVGLLDEIRISDVVRSEDWVKASHSIITDEDFVSYEMDNDWRQYAHKFTVAFTNYTGLTTLENFPVLVKISEASISGFDYADCVKEDGADLRFADENGNLLPCQIEVWNPEGESLIWVKIPALAAGTRITAYYGWGFAPAVTPTDVWDANYLAVWHMGAAAGSRSQTDATANGKTVTCPSTYADAVQSGVVGKIGYAARCGLRADNLGGFSISDFGYFDGFGAITVEAWTYRDVGAEKPGTKDARSIVEKARYSGTWANGWSMYEADNSEKIGFYVYKSDGNGKWLSAPSTAPTQGEWHYHARAWDGTTGRESRTLDATTDSSVTPPASPETLKNITDGTLCIGNRSANSNGPRAFQGVIDEVRISNVARSEDWVNATYSTIALSAKYSTVGDNVNGTVILFK